MFVFAYTIGNVCICLCSHVSGEEPQPGLDLARVSLGLQLLLVEHKGNDEVEGCFRHRLSETSMQPDPAQCQPCLHPLASHPRVYPSAYTLTYPVIHPFTLQISAFYMPGKQVIGPDMVHAYAVAVPRRNRQQRIKAMQHPFHLDSNTLQASPALHTCIGQHSC